MTAIQIPDLRTLRPAQYEFTLARGETRRLAKDVRLLTVKQGCAWLSIGQEDILVKPGESLDLAASSPRPTLLTAMGHAPLVLQVA